MQTSEGYTNDQAGQLSIKTLGSDTATYSYDQTGQLKSAAHSATTSLNESYTYDASGNRTKTGTQSSPNTVSTSNRITADANFTYTYDDEGNLITKTETATAKKWTYSYDLRNRLTGAILTDSGGNMLSQAAYTYDVLDRRIAKTVNGQTSTFNYEGDNLWKQSSASGTTRYLSGGAIDQWMARASSSGVSWYLTDRLGSVTGITDASGNLINSTTYDSYGHILSQSNPAVADSLAFTGREFDAETGLYYLRARYYNPDLGRFQSEDPISIETNYAESKLQELAAFLKASVNPQYGSSVESFTLGILDSRGSQFDHSLRDFNLYRYCINDPSAYRDLSGNSPLSEYGGLIKLGLKTASYAGFIINGGASVYLFHLYFNCLGHSDPAHLADCNSILEPAVKSGLSAIFWVLPRLLLIKLGYFDNL